jgi:hypothetical protein
VYYFIVFAVAYILVYKPYKDQRKKCSYFKDGNDWKQYYEIKTPSVYNFTIGPIAPSSKNLIGPEKTILQYSSSKKAHLNF